MKSNKCINRLISITLIFAVLFSFTGCSKFIEDMNSERYGAKRLAKKEAEEIFTMIREEDIEACPHCFRRMLRKNMP